MYYRGRVAASLEVVWAHSLRASDGEDYDRFVAASAGGHYAQTRAFERPIRAARPSVVRYFLARERGRVLGTALVVRSALGPILLPTAKVERGPVCQAPSDLGRVAAALTRSARARGIVKLAVMPYWAGAEADEASRALVSLGFRDTQRPDGAHARTLRIDLTSTGVETLLAGREHDRLRRRVAHATKAGALARQGGRADLEEHRRLTERMMRAQKRSTRSSAYYDALWASMLSSEARGALFVCEHLGRTLATVVVLRHGGLAVYAEGATTLEPSKISKSVPPLLAAIDWAKKAGCDTFDLGGIPIEDDTDPKRKSIAHLKRDFAETPVSLVHEHTRLF
jgi:lipid II:glycine glycyltransferase (peptidoglycan interpeptide bridge formation enzyme)